jgi:hypothetical protein
MQDLSQQVEQFERLKEEFARLNDMYDAQLKAVGVSEDDLKQIDVLHPPPELKALLDKARAAAKRAGEERAEQAKTEYGVKRRHRAREGALAV